MKRIVIKLPEGPAVPYHYALGPRFDPGVPGEIFEPLNTNPVFFGARGVGLLTREQLMTTEHPQVWFSPQVGVVGVPTQAAQLFLQPLIDPTSV